MAETPEAAETAARRFGECVVKAQIHSGGRGKAGGVRFAASPEEARHVAEALLGATLVTAQTGPEGRVVRRLLVTEPVKVAKEYYLSVTGDSAGAGLMIVGSGEGGTEIEETAASHPEAIAKTRYRWRRASAATRDWRLPAVWAFPERRKRSFPPFSPPWYGYTWRRTAPWWRLIPWVETENGRLLALDAKISFDDNCSLSPSGAFPPAGHRRGGSYGIPGIPV